MKTLQDKVYKTFESQIDEIKDYNRFMNDQILKRVIDLAVKESRGEDINSNINASVNNFIDSFKNIDNED